MVRDAINLIALATLWSVCTSLLGVDFTANLHILDLLGRAASLGAVIGLFIVATAGTVRYAHALRLLDAKAQYRVMECLGGALPSFRVAHHRDACAQMSPFSSQCFDGSLTSYTSGGPVAGAQLHPKRVNAK